MTNYTAVWHQATSYTGKDVVKPVLFRDSQTICNCVSATSPKGLLYSFLLSITHKVSLLIHAVGLPDEIHSCLFHWQGMWGPKIWQKSAQPDTFSLPKNGRLWAVCLDVTCREVPVLTRWSNARESDRIKVKTSGIDKSLFWGEYQQSLIFHFCYTPFLIPLRKPLFVHVTAR